MFRKHLIKNQLGRITKLNITEFFGILCTGSLQFVLLELKDPTLRFKRLSYSELFFSHFL